MLRWKCSQVINFSNSMSSIYSHRMLIKLIYLLVMFSVVVGYVQRIFSSCDLKFSEDGKNVTVFSEVQNMSSVNFIATFSLCDNLIPDFCGERVKICIRRKSDNAIFLVGYDLEPAYLTTNSTQKEYTLYVRKFASPYCEKRHESTQVAVRFECEEDTKEEPKLIVLDECNFEIRLLHPTCIPKCTTRTHNQLIDLRPLMNVYHVYDEVGNFSIGVCKSNPECHALHSISCLFSRNETIPLSGALDNLQFYEDNNIMKIRGKFKGQRRSLDKILEIQIKCDWTKSEPVLYFLKTANQFKTFRFEMLTSYACIKIETDPKIKHGSYLFNFEPLYKKNYYWKIHLTHDSEILMNIFGPLVLLDGDNICSKTNSQICLKNGSEYINLGSIQTPPKFNNDVILITFTSGSTCYKLAGIHLEHEQHETILELICGNDGIGPQLVSTKDCKTHLTWKTPHACPKYDKSTCRNVHLSDQTCLLNVDNYFFNLTSLYKKNDKYTIEDQTNENEYILNICGPVIDDDVPCNDNNLIYLKRKAEADLEKRVVGLGKMKDFYYQNNKLILEMSSGGLCYPHDYQSIIYFECGEAEEGPRLVKRSDCRFEFMWKTPTACPRIKKLKNANCIFVNTNSHIIDLNNLEARHHYLKVNLSRTIYVFDICNSFNENCTSKESCIYASAKKHLLTYGSNTYMEFTLNKSCNSLSDFNRTLMELACDPIQNNDHFDSPRIADCILKLKLLTHLACKNEKSFYLYDIADDNTKNNDEFNESFDQSCNINNPKTHYTFNLMNLKLNFQPNSCPVYRFNYTKNLTELTYATDVLCHSQESKDKTYRYSVLLICSDQYSYNVQKTACQEIHSYGLSEYCKLLEDPLVNNRSSKWLKITGIGFATVVGIVVFTLCILWIRRYKRKSLYSGISYPYNKDGDL